MNCASNNFFSCPAFPLKQYRRCRIHSKLAHSRRHSLHGRTTSNDHAWDQAVIFICFQRFLANWQRPSLHTHHLRYSKPLTASENAAGTTRETASPASLRNLGSPDGTPLP